MELRQKICVCQKGYKGKYVKNCMKWSEIYVYLASKWSKYILHFIPLFMLFLLFPKMPSKCLLSLKFEYWHHITLFGIIFQSANPLFLTKRVIFVLMPLPLIPCFSLPSKLLMGYVGPTWDPPTHKNVVDSENDQNTPSCLKCK